MTTDQKIAELRTQYTQAAGRHFDHWLRAACESPIEQLFLAQMFASGWGPNEEPFRNWMHLHRDITALGYRPGSWILAADGACCACVLQLPVTLGPTTYRIDFAFIGNDGSGNHHRFAVELDGHDFHERTKDQASHDKRRDRALAANGWTVLRFTGSDVYRDPAAVLAEVVATTNKRVWPWLEEEP